MKTYSREKTLLKGLKYFIIFLLPVLVDNFVINYPQLAQLTIGGMLVMLVNYLKVKQGIRI